MKKNLLTVFIVLVSDALTIAQTVTPPPIAPSVAQRLTIAGFCLCQTRAEDLKNLPEMGISPLEEMADPDSCAESRSRHDGMVSYGSPQYPNLIFRTEKNSQNISLIRLTRGFKGWLPDHKFLDLTYLKLKDLFRMYPHFREQWHSKPCSPWWKFSNDTLSFYVRVDPAIKQFPIDKDHYLEYPVVAADFATHCESLWTNPDKRTQAALLEPLYFLDSVRINKMALDLYSAKEIGYVGIVKDADAIRIAGSAGKNGLIYVFTKDYVRDRYWKFLKSRSAPYAKAVPTLPDENNIVYIVNGKVLEKNFEGDLFQINARNFKDLKIVEEQELINRYKVGQKKKGVVITTVY